MNFNIKTEEIILKSTVFIPGHITGFFEIFLDDPDPLKCGSRGAGFCIDKGATTTVRTGPSKEFHLEVLVNGDKLKEGSTTHKVIDYMVGTKPYDIFVETKLDLPVSQGLGMSGAGALGTVVALNEALELNLEAEKLVAFAHKAEVSAKTGLGDVSAQSRGGFEMRTRPGAPPFGFISVKSWETEVLLVVFQPPLSTKDIITSPEHQKVINNLGREMVERIEADFTPDIFTSLARKFTIQSNLASENLLEALKLVPEGFGAGMAMLGNCLFMVGDGVHGEFSNFSTLGECFKAEIFNERTI